MESSPHLPSRSSRTVSPEILEIDGDSTIIIGTHVDDKEMRYSPVRQAPLNTPAKDSFSSYSGRPPPSSPTDTTPLTAFEKHDTLPVFHDYTPTKSHVQTMLAPRTPPRPAQRSLNTPGPSPSRTLSLPMTPTHRSALTEDSESGPIIPHRATAAMAKRSAANPSARKVVPLPSSTTAGPSTPRPGTKKKASAATRNEDDYGADDERAPSNDSSQANLLAATHSLPDLRESPQHRFPLSFLPALIENQKRAPRPPPPQVELSPTRSVAETEASSSMSLHSQEYQYHSRYAQQQQDRPTFRPLTQKPSGVNPPGITVHSQSQSEHAYSPSSGDYRAAVERDYPGLEARVGTTLVAGTPSESSESSQQERELDMSQLYREGRSFMHVGSQEELIPTQVVVHSQDVETLPVDEGFPATQSVDGDSEERTHGHLPATGPYLPGAGKPVELAAHLLSTQSLSVKAVDVSPRKTKGFYSSSSAGTIPGLSNPENGRSSAPSQPSQKQSNSPTRTGTSIPRPEYTPSKPVPISVYQPAISVDPDASSTPNRSNRPTMLRTSRLQNNNLPPGSPSTTTDLIRPFGAVVSTGKASKKPPSAAAAPSGPKKSGLSRWKSPAPVVDQWLAEREAKMREEAAAAAVEMYQDEETAPIEENFTPALPRTSKIPMAIAPAKNGLSRRKSPAPAEDQWLEEREAHMRGLVVGPDHLTQDETAPAEDPLIYVQSRTPKKPAPVPQAKNGLSRRKSPPLAVEQWLIEREAQARTTEGAPPDQDQDEETVPVDGPFLAARNRLSMEETQELPFHPRLHQYTLAGVTETMMAGGGTAVLSENGSVVMETDEELLVETQSDAPAPARSHLTNSPDGERPTERTPKPKTPNEKRGNMLLFGGILRERTESIREPSPVRETSTGTKRSNSLTISAKNSPKWRDNDDESEDSSSVEDEDDDYQPQETQTQDDVFETQVVIDDQEEEMVEEEDTEDEEIRELFPPTSRPGTKKKRGARTQGGRMSKRVCRRIQSPKVSSSAPKILPKSRRAAVVSTNNNTQKAMLPPLDTSVTSHLAGPPSARTTRATQLRGRTSSKALAAPQTVGHLVLVRYVDAKCFFLGYAVVRTGKLWEITPCDGSPTVYSELKNMRDGVFRVDDLVTVSANSGGEDYGDAIVIAVDQHWDEDRTVKVRIGGEEERYVALRYLSVQERHINQWNDRKVTHKELESEDGMESMAAPTSALHRSTSFAVPTPAKSFVSSMRTPQTPAGKIFSGVGFILTSCEPTMTKRLTDCGGYIYDCWLSAFKFGGAFETVEGSKRRRWIRRIPGISNGKGKGRANDLPAVQWVGNEHEQGVKTLFVVAGKVMLTAKTLIALAFGIPCISDKWIKACEDEGKRVDWIPYLLPSHNVPSPFGLNDALPCQAPDYQWGSEKYWNSSVLDGIMNHDPLEHRKILHEKQRILYIAPECVERLAQDYDPRLDPPPCPVPFVYCCLAMGAQHVEAVDQHSHATDKTLLKYDLIVVANCLDEEMKDENHNELSIALNAAKQSGILVINQTKFKMSIACGKLVPP